jgi:hypothetical protein
LVLGEVSDHRDGAFSFGRAPGDRVSLYS